MIATEQLADWAAECARVDAFATGSPVLCRDRWASHPVMPELAAFHEYLGRSCTVPVRGEGMACWDHHNRAHGWGPYKVDHGEAPAPVRKPRRKAGEADPEQAARVAEAMAYVKGYTGTWGLILDLRADPKWGTKWMKLSPRLVEVLLDGKARDEARAAAPQAPVAPREREAEALAWVSANEARNDFASSLAGGIARYGRLTDRQHAAVLAILDRTPRERPDAPAPRIAQDGWYKVGDDIFKVQRAVHGSGSLYAKRLVVADGTASWEYSPGTVRTLTDEQRLTVEQAAEFGHLYGICAVCARTLTDEASIARGIGPVCIGRIA